MQKYAMFMYTSCGWFFDDISRIETVQIMLFAARAMQLANDVTGATLEPEYINILKQAPSNIYAFKSGDKIYDMLVKPTIPANYDFRSHERLID